jgi:hypothetical protein
MEVKTTYKEATGHVSEAAGVGNIFALLKLDMTPEDAIYEDLEDVLELVPANDIHTPEPTEDDAEFAFFCLLKDATDIRFFVRRTWREHKAGPLMLETAAVIMNTAIQVIVHLDVAFLDVCPKFPQFEHHYRILDFVWNKR